MRKITLILVLFFKTFLLKAQETNLGFSCDFISASQWNEMIQTYNTSRPFIINKQPLFSFGPGVSVSQTLISHKKISQGITISYSFLKSKAINENFTNTFNLHLLNLGYFIRYSYSEKGNGAFGELQISTISSGLFRNVDNVPFVYDDARSKAYGIGGNICLKAGYWFDKIKNLDFAPFFQVGYVPYLYAPNSESVINETSGITGKENTGIFNLKTGLLLSLKRKR